MLTQVRIANFKQFDKVEFELGSVSILIGPNNKGKTTALQALSLWKVGLERWQEKRGGKPPAEKRAGVPISRQTLTSIPLLEADHLWRNKRTRSGNKNADGKTVTENIHIEIIVTGMTDDAQWTCGLEFDYANDETIYCRPLRTSDRVAAPRIDPPEAAVKEKLAFLPPMSGLTVTEAKLEPGRINVLIGEGQTAQVLRNLCHRIYADDPNNENWKRLTDHIESLFGVTLLPPEYIRERGEIRMSYRDHSVTLDIQAAGRGMQQTLLLLSHLYANPQTILLLDEPDAHLEILRQRQIYQLLTDVAQRQGSQIIAASHSEVILNEAAQRAVVVAFVGKPHRIDDRGSQVLKSLRDIGYEDYYQCEQTGWVLYLEGSTDLAILQTFAKTLGHQAEKVLERTFVKYLSNNVPQDARNHFYGLREAKTDLVGVAVFDRFEKSLDADASVRIAMWRRREIENYLCQESVLLRYARTRHPDDLFGRPENERWEQCMAESVAEIGQALETLGKPSIWSEDVKASGEVLDPLFDKFFKKLGLPNQLRKTNYHVLASLVLKEEIDTEVTEKLDLIVEVARHAKPVE